MPTQLILPFFPEGSVVISAALRFVKKEGQITYFHYDLPIFSHAENDLPTFRMITSQFYVTGKITQAEISRAFGVTLISVKRAVKLYQTKGVKGFYAPRVTRGATVLTPAVLSDVQQQLDDGLSVTEIAQKMDLKPNTLDKAIRQDRLHVPLKKKTRAT